jgi:hypothetical protein
LGREFYVPEWVERGYMTLVTNEGLISNEDSERIGYKTAVNLYIVRQSTTSSRTPDDIKRQLLNTPVLAEELRFLEVEASQRQRPLKDEGEPLPGQVEESAFQQPEVERPGLSEGVQSTLKKDADHANSRGAEVQEELRRAQEQLASKRNTKSLTGLAQTVNLLVKINNLKVLHEECGKEEEQRSVR